MHAPPASGSAPLLSTCSGKANAPTLNILIVDNDQAQARQVIRQLNLHPRFSEATIKSTVHGLDALVVAEEFHPQLVVVEIGWPRRSGACTARLLRTRAWGKQSVIVSHVRTSLTECQPTADFDFHFFDGFSDVLMAQIYQSLAQRRAIENHATGNLVPRPKMQSYRDTRH